MKKNIVIFITIMFVFSICAIESFSESSEVENIERLLNNRKEIINEFLFNGNDFERLETELRKIEKNTLLKSDLDVLLKIKSNPSNFDFAKEVKVENVISIDKLEDDMSIIAILNWTSDGYEGERKFLKKYEICCSFEKDNIYLTNLQITD